MAELVTAKQNAINDCTHIYLDAFDKKGPIRDLYSEAVAEYLERFIKTENCFSLPKNLYIFENGVWGVAPSRVRAAAPHSAPSLGKGFGDRDREFALLYKKADFFYKLNILS